MTSPSVWTWSDGWLLAVIVTREEIESAVNRLAPAGLVDPGMLVSPTGAAKDLWQRARGEEGGALGRVRRLVELMGREAAQWHETALWNLSLVEYDSAVALCRRRIGKDLNGR
ncbi:MAG: hypothetical protein ACRD0Z_14225 [Acidimicrobiales bacterium]